MKIIFNELPKYLQTNRKSYEGTVLGCVINDIYLLKEYDLTTDLFITKEGELIFTILNKLSVISSERYSSAVIIHNSWG